MHGQGTEQAGVLEGPDEAEPRAPMWSQVPDAGAIEQHVPPVGFDESGDDVEQRGLAGSVRTYHADDLAVPHRQRDVLQSRDPAERLARLPYLEHRGRLGPAR